MAPRTGREAKYFMLTKITGLSACVAKDKMQNLQLYFIASSIFIDTRWNTMWSEAGNYKGSN
jgi:hypothetical protein